MITIPVSHLSETTSTMTEVRNLIDQGVTPPCVVSTDFQTEGRGRTVERIWKSQKRVNLMFTMAVSLESTQLPLTLLPLAAGLCLCLAVEKLTELQPSVKWPNDLLIEGRKISGILCETYKKNLLVGIGLNIRQLDFDPQIKNRAGSLIHFTDHPPAPELFLESFLEQWQSLGSLDIPRMINDRLFKKEELVEFLEGDTLNPVKNRGILRSVASDGALMISDQKGLNSRPYYSGEISFHLPV